MSHQQMLLAGGGQYIIDGADFDGANDYMRLGAGLTGAADSKTGIFSAWVRMDGGGGTQRIFSSSTTAAGSTLRMRAFTDAAKIRVHGYRADGVQILQLVTSASHNPNGSWRHVLASWDAATDTKFLYIDDVSDLVGNAIINSDFDYTLGDWSVGADPDGTDKWNGCLADFYFAPGQYLDFSVTANRRKFIDAAKNPVSLGTDGSLPTGTAPLIYHRLNDGEAVANFATNRGTGGNFAITGTLDTASSSPSD